MARAGGEQTYLALLRGVNVGGRGKVSMERLRDAFVALGFRDVRTVIQSGNVIFSSDTAPSAPEIEAALQASLALETAVVLRADHELQRAVKAVPFGAAELEFVHVGFLRDRIASGLLDSFDLGRFAPERAIASDTELYFFLPDGMGRAKLPAAVARKLPAAMTVRNWNSVMRLLSLLDS